MTSPSKRELKLLSDMQREAEERGEPEVICQNCAHYFVRTDGPTFVGRCELMDEPQLEFGACLGYELPKE